MVGTGLAIPGCVPNMLELLELRVTLAVLALVWVFSRASLWRARRQIGTQKQTLLQILEHVPAGVFVLDREARAVYTNSAGRALLGAPDPEAAAGELSRAYAVYEAGTDRLYPRDRSPLARAMNGESVEVSDMELRRNGESIPLHMRGAPIYGTDGQVVFAVAAFQDARELHRYARRDALTGLANRASAETAYRRDKRLADEAGRPLAIGLIDIDHFKSVNDTFGHAMGDRVLQGVAHAVVGALRQADLVARWGGEEILCILPDTDGAAARDALDRALAAVRALQFVAADGRHVEVTFSAGVALTDRNETLHAVVARADEALYRVKRTGRARVTGYAPSSQPLGEEGARVGQVSARLIQSKRWPVVRPHEEVQRADAGGGGLALDGVEQRGAEPAAAPALGDEHLGDEGVAAGELEVEAEGADAVAGDGVVVERDHHQPDVRVAEQLLERAPRPRRIEREVLHLVQLGGERNDGGGVGESGAADHERLQGGATRRRLPSAAIATSG